MTINKQDAQWSTVHCTPMAPGYISLAYRIDLSCTCYLAKYGRGSISLQSPVNLWYECGFEFVMPKTYLFLFDIVTIATNGNLFSSGAPPVLQRFCLLSVNGDCSASSKVNLPNDDPYRCESATIIMSSFGQIEQGAHSIRKSLIYSTRKVFLERAVTINSTRSLPRVFEKVSTAKVPFKLFLGSYTHTHTHIYSIYINGHQSRSHIPRSRCTCGVNNSCLTYLVHIGLFSLHSGHCMWL